MDRKEYRKGYREGAFDSIAEDNSRWQNGASADWEAGYNDGWARNTPQIPLRHDYGFLTDEQWKGRK
jgi:hypothetical protein